MPPYRPSPASSGDLDQEVFLTIDVPYEKVLLSDFDLWGNCVLNGFYIPADKADIRRFDRMEDWFAPKQCVAMFKRTEPLNA